MDVGYMKKLGFWVFSTIDHQRKCVEKKSDWKRLLDKRRLKFFWLDLSWIKVSLSEKYLVFKKIERFQEDRKVEGEKLKNLVESIWHTPFSYHTSFLSWKRALNPVTSHFHTTPYYLKKKLELNPTTLLLARPPFSYHTSLWKSLGSKPGNFAIGTRHFHMTPHYKKTWALNSATWLFAHPIFMPHLIIKNYKNLKNVIF